MTVPEEGRERKWGGKRDRSRHREDVVVPEVAGKTRGRDGAIKAGLENDEYGKRVWVRTCAVESPVGAVLVSELRSFRLSWFLLKDKKKMCGGV